MILYWIGLIGLAACSADTNLLQENMFRIVTNPNIPADYSSISKHDARSIQECTNLCNSHEDCQAAVFNTERSNCSLHSEVAADAAMNVLPNNLFYMESVCANNANDRPAYCPKLTPVLEDCQAFYEQGYSINGVYTIDIPGSGLGPFEVWCDFFNGHGWTTIQKRFDGSVDFYVYWSDYKNGFGSADGEHWLGNDRIYALTQTNQKLNIYLEAADNTYRNGYWTQFYISDESDEYRLTVTADGFTGDAEEQFVTTQSGMRFSTRDNDNDNHSSANCAVTYTGGWWYNGCHSVQLNGVYGTSGASGVVWSGSWKTHSDPLKKTTMRVTRD